MGWEDVDKYKELQASLVEEDRARRSGQITLPCGKPMKTEHSRARGADSWVGWRFSDDERDLPVYTPCSHIRPIISGGEGSVVCLDSPCTSDWRRFEELSGRIDEVERCWNREILKLKSRHEVIEKLRSAKGSYREAARLLGMSRFHILISWVSRRGLSQEVRTIRLAAAIQSFCDELNDLKVEHYSLRRQEQLKALQTDVIDSLHALEDALLRDAPLPHSGAPGESGAHNV